MPKVFFCSRAQISSGEQYNQKKIKKTFKQFWIHFVITFHKSFCCLKIFSTKWQSWKKKSVFQNAFKNSIFGVSIFSQDFQECSFMIILCKHIENLSKVTTKRIWNCLNYFTIFPDFTVHQEHLRSVANTPHPTKAYFKKTKKKEQMRQNWTNEKEWKSENDERNKENQ